MRLTFPILFIAALAWTSAGEAATVTLEEMYVAKLQKAQNVAVIDQLNREYQQLHILRLACRLQVEAHQVPARCYEALKLEGAWGLRSAHEAANLSRQLDERCQRAAGALHLSSGPDASLSPSCRREVTRARAMQIYRQQGEVNWSGT